MAIAEGEAARIDAPNAPARGGLGDTVLLLAVPGLLIHALLLAVPAPVSIDEFLYLGMADAMAGRGSFALLNGAGYPSDNLTFFLTSVHPGGIMPQYPGGWAFVAAPFHAIGGIRGLLVLNALATIATLWLIRFIGRELTGDARVGTAAALIYLFATFAIDYSAAIWPHALTLACVSAAMAGAAAGWRRDRPAAFLIAGLALGLAVNFRVDAVLLVPPVALWLMGVAGRPWASLGAFALGLVPGYALATVVNWLKFGVAFPLSYGRLEGTHLASYAEVFPLLALGALFALSLGLPAIRARVLHPRGLLALAGLALAAILVVEPLRSMAWRIGHGFVLLVVDIQLLADPAVHPGVERMEDGTLRIYGLMKKALLQSLPWAAALILLLPDLRRSQGRAALALCLLIAAAVIAPFALKDWFGGMANNMRYFLSLLPALAIMGALLLRRLWAEPGRGAVPAALAFALPLVAGAGLAAATGDAPGFALHYTVPNVLVAATALGALALLALGTRPAIVSAVRGLVAAGLAWAFFSAWVLDQVAHQSVRQNYAVMAQGIRALPADMLIYARPEFLFERVNDPRTFIGGGRIDQGLVEWAFARDMPLYVESAELARKLVARGVGGRAELAVDGPWQQIWRVHPPEGAS